VDSDVLRTGLCLCFAIDYRGVPKRNYFQPKLPIAPNSAL